MNEAKLKACPFCGAELAQIVNYNNPAVECLRCRAFGPNGERIGSTGLEIARATAAERWNNRAGDREPATSKTAEPSTLASVSGSTLTAMVDAFLAWPLPADVCADQCACERGYPHRSGTNLLDATQARAMLEHVLAVASNDKIQP